MHVGNIFNMGHLDNINLTPRSRQVDYEELKQLLSNASVSALFCWHDWVNWTLGDAPKLHRVCKKCYKKQHDRNIIPKYSPNWINE